MMKFSLDSKDKSLSFIGMTQALQLNIKAVDHTFQYFAESILDYKDMPDNVKIGTKQVLLQAKALAGDSWERYASQLPFRQELLVNFQV